MTLAEILSLTLFGGVCVGLMAGFPVAFTLGGVSLIFGLIGNAVGAFDLSFFGFIPNRIYGVMTNEILLAVPLFVTPKCFCSTNRSQTSMPLYAWICGWRSANCTKTLGHQ